MEQTIKVTSGEILEVADAKQYLRISDNIHDEDESISEMIVAARIEAEATSHRTLRASVRRTNVVGDNTAVDDFGFGAFGGLASFHGVHSFGWFRRWYFQNPPLHTTPDVKIEFYDANNVLQEVDSSNYFVVPDVITGDENEGVSYVQFDRNFNFPILYDRRPDRILVTYTTGYSSQDLIPQQYKQAVKILVWDAYYGEMNEANLARANKLLLAQNFGFYA